MNMKEISIEEKNGNMRKLELDEVKKIQLQILTYVHNWCIKHNVRYWLDCGTLLGAIRHKGYIPWDDDIDIGMLRGDYDNFCEHFNLENGQYQVVTIENNRHFYQPHAKVIDTNTYLIDGGHPLAVNIDIFVYDNAPDNDKIVQKMFDKRDFLRKLTCLKENNGILDGDSFIKRVGKKLVNFALKFVSNKFLICKMVKNCKKYNKKQTEMVGNFSSFSRTVFSKNIFKEMVDAEFEGQRYKIPSGYDEYLKIFYGDYMILPPIEKRVSNHSFQAYLKESAAKN